MNGLGSTIGDDISLVWQDINTWVSTVSGTDYGTAEAITAGLIALTAGLMWGQRSRRRRSGASTTTYLVLGGLALVAVVGPKIMDAIAANQPPGVTTGNQVIPGVQ